MGAPDCELRHEVVPAWGAATSAGFSCGWTGSHCLPCADCSRRRAEAAKQQQVYDEWISEEAASKLARPTPSPAQGSGR